MADFTPYGWLTTCPASDDNFKNALVKASDADLAKALNVLALALHIVTGKRQ